MSGETNLNDILGAARLVPASYVPLDPEIVARIERIEAKLDRILASGMSTSGQDPKGLEAKPASPTAEGGDAQTPPGDNK